MSDAGKPKNLALVALMRKLMERVNTLVKVDRNGHHNSVYKDGYCERAQHKITMIALCSTQAFSARGIYDRALMTPPRGASIRRWSPPRGPLARASCQTGAKCTADRVLT